MTSAISSKIVAELRAKTDAPLMECKRALVQAEGDLIKAQDILRLKLGNKAQKISDRITAEGTISLHIAEKTAVLLEINCETDFVAKNIMLTGFADLCAKVIADKNPQNVTHLLQMSVENSSLEDQRAQLAGTVGENITLRRFKRYTSNHSWASYSHDRQIGVLVEYQGDAQTARDIAMHIAAMKPLALSEKDVPQDQREKERQIAEQKVLTLNKPPAIQEKMVDGMVQKFLKEVCLLEQAFVKNEQQTIAQLLKEKKTEIYSFACYRIAENIESHA